MNAALLTRRPTATAVSLAIVFLAAVWLLSRCAHAPQPVPELPKRKTKHEYDDQASLAGQNVVPQKY